MAENAYHVVPAPQGGWSVKKNGADRASRHFDKKEDAVKWAKETVKARSASIYVHRRDGTVQSKDTYGSDPVPSSSKAKGK
jgi:hypothetical protein